MDEGVVDLRGAGDKIEWCVTPAGGSVKVVGMSAKRSVHANLFRAVVVMGTAVTSSCGDSKPPVDAAVKDAAHDANTLADAGTDAQASDAPVDAVLIL